MTGRKRVLIVDDHTLLRDGIASLLKEADTIEFVGSVPSGEEAINRLDEYKPDVVLMDIIMKGMTGLEATRWIKENNPKVKVIIISGVVSKEYVSQGIKCGIDGYLPKNVDKETLLTAIEAVAGGEKSFNQAITNLVFEDFYRSEQQGRKPRKISKELSKRENDVLRLVACGKSNQEVADALFISVKTVETHRSSILLKLGLKNTAELVRYAIKNDIVSLDEP